MSAKLLVNAARRLRPGGYGELRDYLYARRHTMIGASDAGLSVTGTRPGGLAKLYKE